MNKCALYIPRPGGTSYMIRRGYVDALRHLGWKVYIADPKVKLNCCKLIEDHNIRLIMTHSRYGIRQLPIDSININNITVFIEALPLNNDGLTIDDPYEIAHYDEPDIIKTINSAVVHTRIEPHLWVDYMQIWNNNVNLIHLPVAGNLLRALPPTCANITDVAMIANFTHRYKIMQKMIKPLFQRLELLNYSYQAFGDDVWIKAGLNYSGPLKDDIDRIARVYATAYVCPNVHTEQQVRIQAYINERSFMIPLCGGVQVSDNSLANKYLGSHCEIARSTTDFITKVIHLIEYRAERFKNIRAGIEHVANNHTYFNRLADLFHAAGLLGFADEAETNGNKMAIRHCLEMDVRLSVEERGIPYEQNIIKTT